MWAERRSPSASSLLLVLLLHAGLLALLTARSPPLDSPRTWSTLHLIPERPTEPPRNTAPAAEPMPRAPAARTVMPAPPAFGMPPGADHADVPLAGPGEPPASSPPPLQLVLPAGGALPRQPALDDPRSNTAISRFGARIAHDLGDDGRWVEERMEGADFVRLRRGNTCINLHRNSGSARERFNEAVSPTLWGATPAYRCERR